MPQVRPQTGNPTWLAEALRAEGLDPVEFTGWRHRGHGTFKDIRGVMVHHTGSDRASAASIAEGRPDLAGPLSQVHIARDGTVTVVAAGVAWHAGVGMYPWVPANMGNWHLIGVECLLRTFVDAGRNRHELDIAAVACEATDGATLADVRRKPEHAGLLRVAMDFG